MSTVAFTGANAATALAAVTVPGSTSAGQVEKRFEQPPAMLETPNLLPIPGENTTSPEAQAKLAKIKFVLSSVSTEGVTVYKAEDLKSTYSDMLGKNISLLDAQEIAKRITALYHKDGYVLSQAVVPPQDVAGGVLKIRVVEGFVGGVIVPDSVGSESERKIIESYADHIKAERPVNTQTLEHYLLLINDLPGVTVNGLLRPSATGVGSADLVINVINKPFEASYVFDNRGSKYVGPWQNTISGTANSLFGLYDSTRLRVFTSTPDSNQLLGGDILHEEQIGSYGTKLSFLASHTHTQPGDVLTPLQIVGNSDLFEVKATQPFIRSRMENLIGRILVDYHDTVTDIFKTIDYTTDRLRVARAGLTYNIVDSLRGNNLVDAQLSQGMDIFGATSSGANRSNAVGDSSFTKINMDMSRTQPLPSNFSLMTGATMQHSFNPLLADEQFSLGGSDYARAFDPAELLGDQGLAGKGELRYNGNVGAQYFNSYQLYTFYDLGRVWLLQGAAGTSGTSVLSSTGVGVRMTLTENFSANFEAAVPLVAPAQDQTSYRHDPRLFMSLVLRF
ncbi:MAG: ShlB/FhaC/HecB family hemolysin secretion/activation protein [Alphaproteobacteria bacterium]